MGTHADLAHKYDFGPGRECVHWEARRKQRTVDKRDEALQQLNVSSGLMKDVIDVMPQPVPLLFRSFFHSFTF